MPAAVTKNVDHLFASRYGRGFSWKADDIVCIKRWRLTCAAVCDQFETIIPLTDMFPLGEAKLPSVTKS
jgi:hypothetical protein